LKTDKPHYFGHKKRLRERFLKSGAGGLADYELLELILGMAIMRKDVKPLAKDLLARFGSFSAIIDADMEKLLEVNGIGPGAAAALRLVKEASIKYLGEKGKKGPIISSPGRLIDYCKAAMMGLKDEQFRVVFLNSKNEVIEDEVICRGTIDQTAVYPRKVMERALYYKAASYIFVHNHPSGNYFPSRADKELTISLKKAAQALHIRVHDHLIIGKDGYYSFAEEGFL